MKRLLLFLVILLLVNIKSYCNSNDSITIDICFAQAIENYPLLKQKTTLSQLNQLRISNFNKIYLPQVFVNAQATYQSDVTQLQLPSSMTGNMNIKEMSKDQYKMTLDINQIIYDGGMVKAQKEIEELNTQIELQNVETELYKLKERIVQFYFTIELLNKNEMILDLLEKDISAKRTKINSMVDNGVLIRTNLDVLEAELLKISQQRIELQSNKLTAINMLAELTGMPLSINTIFNIPTNQTDNIVFDNKRPELKIMSLQSEKIEQMKELHNIKLRPKINAFGQVGYGRPALNMLNPDFDKFYIVGAKLNWNIYNWQQNKQEKQILTLQKDIINNQKEVFDKNTKILSYQYQNEIEKLKEQIEKDKQIINLCEGIVKNYSSQLDNGTITSTEYMSEVYNKAKAELNLEYHKINKIKAYYNYMYLIGEL